MRSDMPNYRSSLSKADNWIISPHGGLLFREGLRKSIETLVNAAFRLFTFRRGGDTSDILIEVTAGKFRYFIDDVQQAQTTLFLVDDLGNPIVAAPGTPLIIGALVGDNNFLQAELEDLYFTNNDIFGVIVHPDHSPTLITVTQDLTITEKQLPFIRVPSHDYRDAKSPNVAAESNTLDIVVAADWVQGNQYLISYAGVFAADPADGAPPTRFTWQTTGATPEVTNANNIEAGLESAILLLGFSPALTVVVTPGAGVNDPYVVALTGPNAGFEVAMFPLSGQSRPVIAPTTTSALGNEPAWSYPYVVTNGATPNFFECIKAHLSVAGVGGNEPGVATTSDTFWKDLGTVAPSFFDYQHGDGSPGSGANAWLDATQYATWGRGFPTVAEFHQQRLILSANKSGPIIMWGSEIGKFENFEPGSQANDPFVFELDSSDEPKIKWMRSQFNLLVGTSSGDWLVTSGTGAALSPANIQADRQNNARSEHVSSVGVDTDIFYIEQGGTKLRATRFVRDLQSFSSADVSVKAEQLLQVGIKRLALMYVPEVLMCMVTNDKKMLLLTYVRDQEVVAWSSAGSSPAEILDVTHYYSVVTNEDSFFFAVKRNGKHYIEQMTYPRRGIITVLTTNNVVLSDGWISGTVNSADQQALGGTTRIIAGLDSLEGLVVNVQVDDALQVETFTVTAGKVTLSEDSSGLPFAVGVAYSGEAITFEQVSGNPQGVGFGRPRRWNRPQARCLDSAVPLINGQLPEDRTPAVFMGTAEVVRAGIVDYEITNLGWDKGEITMRQNDPVPTHILGLFGEYTVGTS